MGGCGSTRWRSHYRKGTTDELLRLDVLFMLRRGALKTGNMSTWSWSRHGEAFASICSTTVSADEVELHYSTGKGDGKRQHDYGVRIAWTPCFFGGQRPWFICPRCGRMVRMLYGGELFLCRHCQRLAYEVQRESFTARMRRRADKVRDRLGWTYDDEGEKPKGMHWSTFDRLAQELDRRERAADFAFTLRAHELIGGDLNDLLGFPRGTVEKYGIDARGPHRRAKASAG